MANRVHESIAVNPSFSLDFGQLPEFQVSGIRSATRLVVKIIALLKEAIEKKVHFHIGIGFIHQNSHVNIYKNRLFSFWNFVISNHFYR